MALSAVSGGGTQTTTQNPQASGQASGGAQSSSIQPGTTSTLLTTNSGGEPLTPGGLTTVSLGATSSTQTISNPPVKHHHANPVLVGMSVSLFVLAVLMFWLTSRSEKNTTI